MSRTCVQIDLTRLELRFSVFRLREPGTSEFCSFVQRRPFWEDGSRSTPYCWPENAKVRKLCLWPELASCRRAGEERPSFKSVANAIRTGIFIERIYRRMSSSQLMAIPPDIAKVLKVRILQFILYFCRSFKLTQILNVPRLTKEDFWLCHDNKFIMNIPKTAYNTTQIWKEALLSRYIWGKRASFCQRLWRRLETRLHFMAQPNFAHSF